MSPVVGQIPGVPGGPELLIILMMGVFFVALVAGAVAVGRALTGGGRNDGLRERVALLEHEVAELQEQIDEKK